MGGKRLEYHQQSDGENGAHSPIGVNIDLDVCLTGRKQIQMDGIVFKSSIPWATETEPKGLRQSINCMKWGISGIRTTMSNM